MAKKPEQPKKPWPECLAIIICEGVVEDARTHNKCILNAYNTIYSRQYPARHDRLTIFLSLTSGHSDVPMELSLGKPGEDPMVKMGAVARFPDPRAVVDLVVSLRNVPIPEAGEYVVQVLVHEGHILCQRRLRAVLQSADGGKRP